MTTRETALSQISALAREHNLTADDIAAQLIRDGAKTPEGQANMLVRLLSYLGGLLVFCGIGFFISLQWDALDSLSRVIITFGPGLIALILAVATVRDERYVRASTPLFLIAAFMQPLGFFVFLSEYFTGNDTPLAAMIVFGPMFIQMAALFWSLKRTSLAFFALSFAFLFFWALMEKIGMDGDVIATGLGLSGLLVSAAVNRTPHRAFVPFSYLVFAACLAGGMFALLEGSIADVLLLAVAYLLIFASVRAQSRALLFAGVVTTLAYLCYFTDRYFAETIGWPIALIVLGLVMIGLSAYAVKLGKSIKTNG